MRQDLMWRTIPEYPEYELSECGDVYSHRSSRIIKPWDRGNGYLQITLCNERGHHKEYIHRLVAKTFIPNPYDFYEVNHIDGNPYNNTIDNLEWTNRSGNTRHAWKTGLRVATERHRHPGKRIRVVETGEEYKSIRDCARSIGVNQPNISSCLAGRRLTVNGLHFEYV